MGWSLGGILAGAGKGMADWAGREIVAEKQAERDAEQFARQKELATFQDELAAGRAERTAELTKRYADKTATEKKDTQASAFEALEWAATKDPEGPKLKPGTAEYYRFLGDKLDASGEPDMAKQMYSNADKFEDNAIRREQNRVLAARAAGGGSSAKQDEVDRKRELDIQKAIEGSGTFKRTSKVDGETKTDIDSSGGDNLKLFYAQTGSLEDVHQAAGLAKSMVSKDPNLTMADATALAIRTVVTNAQKERARQGDADAAAGGKFMSGIEGDVGILDASLGGMPTFRDPNAIRGTGDKLRSSGAQRYSAAGIPLTESNLEVGSKPQRGGVSLPKWVDEMNAYGAGNVGVPRSQR